MAGKTLAAKIADDLRSDLAAGDYPPGTRLPTEAQLTDRFQASRPTVRSALRQLEALGLVQTQHGVGTFVVEQPAVRAGLEQLDSITDSIRAIGKEPGMIYASRLVRHVLPEEASQMGVTTDTQVLETRRTIFADGEVVAYSYDLLPMSLMPPDFDVERVSGSLFKFLRSYLHADPHHGTALIHAVHSDHVGWGAEAAAHNLFVLLNQLHYDADDRLLLYSRTYFIEGRYEFTIYRDCRSS